MVKQKILLGIILIILGTIGIASLLTVEIPLPAEAESILKEKFTANQIKLLILINPLLMLIIAVVIGTLLYKKVHFEVPVIEKIVGLKHDKLMLSDILKYGILGGVISGILLSLSGLFFSSMLPAEFIALGESIKLTLAARFLYGGITEEILMRFGLMTLIVWVTSKIFNGTLAYVYWIGILLAALIFAIGHFPVAFQAVENPSIGLLAYIMIGNSIGGVIFGWLYWKKGLESAFIAHIFAHIIMVLAQPIIN